MQSSPVIFPLGFFWPSPYLFDVCGDAESEGRRDLVGDEVANVEGEGEQAREQNNLRGGARCELVPALHNFADFARENANNADLQQGQGAHFRQEVNLVQPQVPRQQLAANDGFERRKNHAQNRVKGPDIGKAHVSVKGQRHAQHNRHHCPLPLRRVHLLVVDHADAHDDYGHQRAAHLVEIHRHPAQRSVADGNVERKDDGKEDDGAAMKAFDLLGLDGSAVRIWVGGSVVGVGQLASLSVRLCVCASVRLCVRGSKAAVRGNSPR